MTIIIMRGLRTDHAIPSTLRRSALEVLGDELLQDEAVLIEFGFCERLNVSGGGSGFCHERRSSVEGQDNGSF